jgi:hypothetical protein
MQEHPSACIHVASNLVYTYPGEGLQLQRCMEIRPPRSLGPGWQDFGAERGAEPYIRCSLGGFSLLQDRLAPLLRLGGGCRLHGELVPHAGQEAADQTAEPAGADAVGEDAAVVHTK